MGGANASRWVRIPILGMSFQTSAFASLALLIWLAKWFSKSREILTFRDMKAPLLMIGTTLILILPADFSTTAVIFTMAFILMTVAGVPWKLLWKIIAGRPRRSSHIRPDCIGLSRNIKSGCDLESTHCKFCRCK